MYKNLDLVKKYIELIVKCGANIQKGQEVVVQASTEIVDFIIPLVEECYKNGAKNVEVIWENSGLSLLDYKYRSVDDLANLKDYQKAKWEHYVKNEPVRIYIESSAPDELKDIDGAKFAEVRKILGPQIRKYRDLIDDNYQWVIAGVPSKRWAKTIFPSLNEDEAVEKLWEAILNVSRVYENTSPIDEWDRHNKNLEERSSKLNSLKLVKLQYKSSNGTDFSLELNPDVKWEGGGEFTKNTKVFFNPNIPSEEIFTSPIAGKIEGKVIATKPLSYNGNLIEDFSFVFKDGKVVEVHAKKGESILKDMVKMDEGASMLGECALIPYDSPINNTNILFYNTLFDENASCHLALGAGFTNLYKDYEKYTLDELKERGINKSMIHVDFMIGSKDLDIVGFDKDGNKFQIFKDGNWAF